MKSTFQSTPLSQLTWTASHATLSLGLLIVQPKTCSQSHRLKYDLQLIIVFVDSMSAKRKPKARAFFNYTFFKLNHTDLQFNEE